MTSTIYVVITVHLHRGQEPECAPASKLQHDPSTSTSSTRTHYPNLPPPREPAAPPRTTSTNTTTTTTKATLSRLIHRLPPLPSPARHQSFLLYPLIYLLCTTPLAAGRLASMAGHDVSLAYFCVAGGMITSAGWLDAALYGLTRRGLVFGGAGAGGAGAPGPDTGLGTFAFMRTPAGRRYGNVVFVSGGVTSDQAPEQVPGGRQGGRPGRAGWNAVGSQGGWLGRGARLLGREKGMTELSGDGSKETVFFSSWQGFGGMGAGEAIGMTIRCQTITQVTREETSDAAPDLEKQAVHAVE